MINDNELRSSFDFMSKQEEEEFIYQVFCRLPKIYYDDKEAVRSCISDLYRRGWSMSKVVEFCLCLEEVIPGQDEEMALRKMAALEKDLIG